MSLNRPDPPPMGPVANLLAMDRTTLTAALKPLERRGLVRVAKDQNDARIRVLILTPRGRELLSRAVPIWQSTHAELEGLLTGPTTELALVQSALEKLQEIMELFSLPRQ